MDIVLGLCGMGVVLGVNDQHLAAFCEHDMKSIWVSIQVAFSALGGFLGWYLGGVDGFLYALIAFVLVDYITGVMCAIADKKLSSAVGFKGICRKVLIFVLVGIGNLVDVYVLPC